MLNSAPLAPLNKNFFGQICSCEIKTSDPEALQALLFEKYKIEIPIVEHRGKCYIRISFNAFNCVSEIDYLLDSLTEISEKHKAILKL